MSRYYAIYRKRDDELLACGSAEQCAKMMGYTSLRSFEDICRRSMAGTLSKYELYIEDVDDVAESRESYLQMYGFDPTVLDGNANGGESL